MKVKEKVGIEYLKTRHLFSTQVGDHHNYLSIGGVKQPIITSHKRTIGQLVLVYSLFLLDTQPVSYKLGGVKFSGKCQSM